MALEDIAYELGRTAAENPGYTAFAGTAASSALYTAHKMLESKAESMTEYELKEALEDSRLTGRYYSNKLEERFQEKQEASDYSASWADD